MQKSINNALLFVIAMSTAIIAVELIPQHRVNSYRLRCAEIAGYGDFTTPGNSSKWLNLYYKLEKDLGFDRDKQAKNEEKNKARTLDQIKKGLANQAKFNTEIFCKQAFDIEV